MDNNYITVSVLILFKCTVNIKKNYLLLILGLGWISYSIYGRISVIEIILPDKAHQIRHSKFQQDWRKKKKIEFVNILNRNNFQVWLWNRLLSAGLEPVLSQTEKSCIASDYRQFSTNIIIFILISAESCLLYDATNILSFIFNKNDNIYKKRNSRN